MKKLEKYVHVDSNKNRSGIQTLFWYIAIIPFYVFTVASGLGLFIYFAIDNNKSYNISNVGFAILLGLASICFSYCKLLDNGKYEKIYKDTQRSGEFFLISAIAFIISSALKYSWTVLPEISWFRKGSLRIIFGYTFFFAEVTCIIGLAKLVDVLYIRVTNPKN